MIVFYFCFFNGYSCVVFFFFFQAEDGIRDVAVTGVQTCALPIWLKDVKVAFDLKEGDGKLLLSRLDVIDETRQSLIQQGVTPHFILAFRGPATKLVQTDLD